MTNAIGGQIKVTLTLDDAGFTVKTRQASSTIKAMNTDLRNVSKVAEGLETKLGTLGKNVSLSSNNLKMLQASAKSLEKQFSSVTKTMSAFASNSKQSANGSDALNNSITRLAGVLDRYANNTERAATGTRALTSAQREANTIGKGTVNGLSAQERALRNLGERHQQTATQIVTAAGLRRNEIARATAAEIDANSKQIRSKQAALASMLRAEREYQNTLNAERAKQMALQMRVDSRRDTNGRMMSVNSSVYQGYQRELQLQNQKVAGLQRSVQLIGQEGIKLQGNIASLNTINRSLNTRIDLESRIESALQRQKQRQEEYLRSQRQAVENTRQQIDMQREQMQLLKGMAQIYAGSKIMEGERASIRSAAEFERNQVRAKAFGSTKQEMDDFNRMVWYDSINNPGVSVNDASTARIAAMGGLAKKNHGVINQTLGSAITGAQNIQYITGDEGHESFENLIRNLYGVVEARQQQYSPDEAKKTFDLITQMVASTGNKIDIADLETFLRRIGFGNAAKISDDGILNIVALLDQAKVSGGGGGGGAGGVSTIGTMVKMLQAYANGKGLSQEAMRQAAEAGIINTDGVDRSGNAKQQMKALKNAGFNDVNKFNTDPVSAVRDMMAAALATMSSEKNRKKYFGEADINDPEAQRDAMAKWATRMGFTTTAANFMMTIADPRAVERADAQRELAKGSLNNEELKDVRMETYGQSVKNFEAAMENLKVVLGSSVLPMVTDLFNWITKVVGAMQQFASENQTVTQLAMISGAIGGVLLGLKGLMTVFGVVGNLRVLLASLGPAAATASTSAVTLGGAARVTGALLGAMLKPVTSLVGIFARMTGAAAAFRAGLLALSMGPLGTIGARLLAVGARFAGLQASVLLAGKVIGKAFLRMIPFVGWLYTAWELGGLLMNVEVGFTKIGDYIGHWMTQMLSKGESFGRRMASYFLLGDAKKANDARIIELEAGAQDDASYFENLKKSNKEFAEQEQKRQADRKKEEQDFINGVGFGHETPEAPKIYNDNGFIIGEGDGKGGKGGSGTKVPRDYFARQLAQVTEKQAVTAMQITSAISGRADSLLEQARTEFFEKWKGGDFDPGHNEALRPFKNGSGGLDWKASSAKGGPSDWIESRVAMLQQEEQLKGLTYANQRVAAAREDANTAMERGAEDTAKVTREMAGLERELARTEERLRNGTKEFDAWNAKKSEALFQRSRADLVNFSADFVEGDRQTAQGMIFNTRDRAGAEFDIKAQKDLETYNFRLATMVKHYEDSKVGIKSLGLTQAEELERMTQLDAEFNDARTKAEAAFTEHVKVQANAREYAMRGAIQKMQEEWENAYDKIDQIGANWGNSFIDQLSTVLTGGSVSWREFLASMLKDVLDMQLKQMLAKPMSGILDSLTTGIKGMLGKGTVNDPNTTTGAIGAAVGSVAGQPGFLSQAGSVLSGGLSSVGSFFGLDKLTGASKQATDSVKALANDGAAAATAGLVKQAAQTAVGISTDMSATAALTSLSVAAQYATQALASMAMSSGGSSSGIGGLLGLVGQGVASYYGGSYGGAATATSGVTSGTGTGFGLGQQLVGTSSVFAKGGIMSAGGSLPLKAYSKGGIANSPQLALFGEGRQNEAYVPLPDGRTIPVTFTGDAGSSNGGVYSPVTISIHVEQNGDTKEESAGGNGDAQAWKELAVKVKTLVRQELVTQHRNGGIMDRNK